MLLIDKTSSKPVYEQIIEGIERNVLLGLYPIETQVPSVRELSLTLGINPNTIQKSYAELIHRGVIYSAHGSGCFVSSDARARILERARERLTDLQKTVRELHMAGIEKRELLEAVESALENGNR